MKTTLEQTTRLWTKTNKVLMLDLNALQDQGRKIGSGVPHMIFNSFTFVNIKIMSLCHK